MCRPTHEGACWRYPRLHFAALENLLVETGEPKVPGFGFFCVKIRAARTARNLKTGEPVKVAEGKVLTFSPSESLKNRMQEGAV
jgi:nucleoid DNA-binding protein